MEQLGTPTAELAEGAYFEARHFAMPRDWRDGRAHVHGIAIDEAYSPDVDDAIDVITGPWGDEVLVHISDTGTFLPPYDNTALLAQRRLQTKYAVRSIITPMLPKRFSEDLFSLLHGVERPVVTVRVPVDARGQAGEAHISRNIITTTRLTPEQADEALEEDSGTGNTLRHLEIIARRLFVARHNYIYSPEEARLEDNDDTARRFETAMSVSRLIVQECMIMANAAVARYMDDKDIPALFRNFNDRRVTADGTVNLLASRATYGVEPTGHRMVGHNPYCHATSPIRRFSDFANHANLTAELDGYAIPYPRYILQRIAERHARLNLQQRSYAFINKSQGGEGNANAHADTAWLIQRLKGENAKPGDIARALFDSVGTSEELAQLKRLTADYIATHITQAKPAIVVGIARQLVRVIETPVLTEEGLQTSQEFIDHLGNNHPYTFNTDKLQDALTHVELISRILEIPITPVIPYDMTPEGRAMHESAQYLRQLQKEFRLRRAATFEKTDEGIRAIVNITFDGATHTAIASGQNRNEALQLACSELIKRHDLYHAKPAVQRTFVPKSALFNPVVVLKARQETNSIPPASYEITGCAEGAGFSCTVTITDTDGTVHTANATATTKKGAQRAAAAALLGHIPRLPMNKKGQLYPTTFYL